MSPYASPEGPYGAQQRAGHRPPGTAQRRPQPGRGPAPSRSRAGSSLHLPSLGAAIAGAGLVLLWMATRSTPWIDNAGGTLSLTELGGAAEALGQFRVVRWYADWGWLLLTFYVAYVAMLATLLNPTSRAARTLLWLPVAGPFALFNMTDGSGRAAPRVLGVLTMLAPAALLGAVWVDLLVEPKLDPTVESLPELDIDPGDLSDVSDLESLPDPDALRDLAGNGDLSGVDLETLATLGFDWRGFATDEIGNGLWMSFVAVAVVAVGAVVGTRAARR